VGAPPLSSTGESNPPPTASRPLGQAAVTVTGSLSAEVDPVALTTVTGGDAGFFFFFFASAAAAPSSSGRSAATSVISPTVRKFHGKRP
jgi:hypothetical protein